MSTLTAPKPKKTAKKWIRNAADERAVARGFYFDAARGQHAIDFIQKHLRLYEGEYAGKPVVLMPWQIDCLMRLFGWVHFSEEWGRVVRRFRKVSIWVPKKNGKSPMAAMIGLYLFCADGEQGQKVFSAAKDGKQARIMHTHAMMMVRKSPALLGHCKINNGTGQIFHVPTDSTYAIIAGDNIAGQEGINGSVVKDEVHVVDTRLASTLEFAGASRAEPIDVEVSTVGDNLQSYGYRQWEYGLGVEKGDIDDDRFLFIAYAAPQNATDEQLGDPQVWRLANPSWGVTIKESEFRAAYTKACRSPEGLAEFCKYRLNIWQRTGKPWLSGHDWDACLDTFTAEDLHGRECHAGLDLSRTNDTTALVLMFDNLDGSYCQLSYFWLPEDTAEKYGHLVPFATWAKQGHLRLIPGPVIQFGVVEAELLEIIKPYKLKKLWYDQAYADEMAQRLETKHRVKCGPFAQTIMKFCGPTAEYERLVLAHQLLHNGNPVMTWQAGHAQTVRDRNDNKRPVKPESQIKKIDGVVAGIMALGGLTNSEAESETWHYRPGQLAN